MKLENEQTYNPSAWWLDESNRKATMSEGICLDIGTDRRKC